MTNKDEIGLIFGKWQLARDTQLINGTAQIMPDTAGFGFPTNSALHPVFGKFGSLKRAQYGQASFIFMEEKGEQNAD